jgi:small-conductance mechanosensitive channel
MEDRQSAGGLDWILASMDSAVLGRPVKAYLIALGILLAVLLATRVFKRLLLGRLRQAAARSATSTDDFIVEQLEHVLPTLGWVAALWLVSKQLGLPEKAEGVVLGILLTVAVIVCARALLASANYASRGYFARRYGGDDTRALVLRPILAVVVWTIALVFVLDNLGFKVSTVLAGLGIGGIAVALAAQAVLGDLFSYFAIVFDRPFAIGDFIVVDTLRGTVERIGIKTTRVRSLDGELIVFGNANLLSNRIRNFKMMEKRRVEFRFGLEYGSPARALAEVPALVKEIVTSREDVTFDRAHFKAFGDSSLDFEVIYWVLNPDYNRYMDIQQAINFALKEQIEARGLAFAFPTRTVHVVGGAGTNPGAPA